MNSILQQNKLKSSKKDNLLICKGITIYNYRFRKPKPDSKRLTWDTLIKIVLIIYFPC